MPSPVRKRTMLLWLCPAACPNAFTPKFIRSINVSTTFNEEASNVYMAFLGCLNQRSRSVRVDGVQISSASNEKSSSVKVAILRSNEKHNFHSAAETPALAPRSMRKRTTPMWPFLAARISSVDPHKSLSSEYTPRSVRKRTTSMRPPLASRISAVLPQVSSALKLAPRSTRKQDTSIRPC
jgi:hypothetical protein